MKNWHALLLCFSIVGATAGSAFYLKYEPETLLQTNYGPVNLGKVFAEKVALDISITDLTSSNDNSYHSLTEGESFYDKIEPVNKAMEDYFNSIYAKSNAEDKIEYDQATPNKNMRLKLRTYISYYSSNFQNMPYTMTIREETYDLPKNESLKANIEKAIHKNFEATLPSIRESLFMTDLKQFDKYQAATTQ